MFFSSLVIFPLGMWTGWRITRHLIAEQARVRIEEYRKRWLDALELMKSEGQISDEQVKKLTAEAAPPQPVQQMSRARQMDMSTWDRRDLEIERAKHGLAPADDLRGMASWDIRDVEEARIKYASRRR